MVYVPEGSFEMGSITGSDNEKPIHEVFLEAFYIDRLEVSNSQYERCVNAGQCDPPIDTSSVTRSRYYGNFSYINYPVINVSWYNARDYCIWAGGRLPTEAEWEKAARGTDSRKYPWGNGYPNCSLTNFYNEASGSHCIGDTSSGDSYITGASPFGALNMAGNVGEWVNDWYGKDYINPEPVSNPTGPTSGDSKVIRGGGWSDPPFGLVSTFRSYAAPDSFIGVGFRCVLPEP